MGTAAPEMVGRRAELQILRDAFDSVLASQPQVVVIGGEAGIGKTRVVAEFVRTLDDDVFVASGVCVDLADAGAPFIPIRSILRDAVTALGEDAVRRGAGSAPDALMTLVDGAQVDHSASGTAGRLREGFLRLLEATATARPTVILVEDVHWADSSTLGLLQYVTRLLRDARVMVLLTARTGDMPRAHRTELAELERLQAVTRVELPPLSPDEVAQMAGAPAGAQATPAAAATKTAVDVARLHQRSGGIPFFVEELLAAGDDGIPRTASDLIVARFESLDPTTQRVLRLMAVGGLRLEHDLLEAVSDLDADALEAAIREAVDAGLVVADRSGYAFRHALVREVVDGELMPGERSRNHVRYATTLAASGSASDVEISTHWLSARRHDEAFAAAVRAMDDATRTYALPTAAAMAERCVDIWDQVTDAVAASAGERWEMLVRGARAHRDAGNDERALALTELAIDEVGEADPLVLARLRNDVGLDLYRLGRPGSAPMLQSALDLAESDSSDAGEILRAMILSNLAAAMMMRGESTEALRIAERAVEAGIAAGPDAHGSASVGANIAGVSLIDLDREDEAMARFAQARELAGDRWAPRARLAINLSDTLMLLDRPGEALQVAQEALDEARRRGEERSTGTMLATNAIEPLFALGEWDRAREILDRALAGDAPMAFRRYLDHLRLWLLIWAGDVEEAAAWNRSIRAEQDRIGRHERQVQTGTAYDEAEMRLAAGDPAGAFAVLEPQVWDGGTDRPADRSLLVATAARAHGLIRDAGQPSPRNREDFLAVLEPLRHRPASAVWIAIADAEIEDDPALRERAWEEAIGLLAEGHGHRHLLPYGRVRQAAALLAMGDRDAALDRLESARADAEALGAGLIVRMADRIAARAGLARPAPAGDHTELTARERQVLALVAEGLTNRQIGERLFISGKTASVHVSALLRKLGASSRAEAAALAAGVLDDPTA